MTDHAASEQQVRRPGRVTLVADLMILLSIAGLLSIIVPALLMPTAIGLLRGREWARGHAVQLLVIGSVALTVVLTILVIDLIRAWASQGFPGWDDVVQRGGAGLFLLSLAGFLHWLRRGCQSVTALRFFTARSATRIQPVAAIAAT
jgi:hypothetical protein